MNSCASQASTAVCMSLDQPSSSSSAAAANQFGGRTIDRHNPIIRDTRRSTAPKTALSLAPCTSQPPPINPQPYRLLQKSTKDQIKISISRKSNAKKAAEKKSKRITSEDERKKKEFSAPATGKEDAIVKKNWGKRVDDLITPPGSSRYLLSEKDLIDYDPVLALVPVDAQSNTRNLIHSSSSSSSSSSNASLRPSSQVQQVVVLKVSLHCRGCEGKVRKHISRMEGVRSFNIDFAAKKVTIEGDVTPLGVLASISKVKNAQFWTPPSLSTK